MHHVKRLGKGQFLLVHNAAQAAYAGDAVRVLEHAGRRLEPEHPKEVFVQFQRVGHLRETFVGGIGVVIKYGAVLAGVRNADGGVGVEVVYFVVLQRHNQAAVNAVGGRVLVLGIVAFIFKVVEGRQLNFHQVKIQPDGHVDGVDRVFKGAFINHFGFHARQQVQGGGHGQPGAYLVKVGRPDIRRGYIYRTGLQRGGRKDTESKK